MSLISQKPRNTDGLRECSRLCMKESNQCKVKDCRLWQNYPDDYNCTLVTVYEHGPLTLAETAKRMGLSLSRVKQIEQKALEKLKKRKIFDF